MSLPSPDFVALEAVCKRISTRAECVDYRAELPLDDLADLAHAGLIGAVLPTAERPTSVSDPGALGKVLRMIGAASLTVGRLYEGHVNAAKLIHSYGDCNSCWLLASEAQEGRLLGVWNAERGDGPRMTAVEGGWRLSGRKVHCSGAGHIRRPIVTARDPDDQVRMLLPDISGVGVRLDTSVWRAAGMRGTATATVVFEDMFVSANAAIGGPGDYYRSPMFSGGAWRVLAVQLGGLERILKLHAERLLSSGRHEDPVFRARFAVAAASFECARLLVEQAGKRAEDTDVDPSAIDAYVDMARGQFENLALAGIDAARRNVGLSSFIAPDPLDRCIRDLETYLRQPFVDASRDHAVRWLLPRGGAFGG